MTAAAGGAGDVASIAAGVALGFLFGYAFTSVSLLRAGLALGAIVPIALAADTVSIAIMELIDNLTIVLVPPKLSQIMFGSSPANPKAYRSRHGEPC
jgi:Domain of unknown function (DUF4396)